MSGERTLYIPESALRDKQEQQEREQHDPYAGLHARLLLADKDLMNPNKEIPQGKEKQIKRDINKRNYQPFERTSEHDRRKFWEEQTAKGTVKNDTEKYYLWQEALLTGINKLSPEKRRDTFNPLFKQMNIHNTDEFTEADARTLYDHYFSKKDPDNPEKEKDPDKRGVKQFVKDILATHSRNGKLDRKKLNQSLPDIKQFAVIFGYESADMLEHLILAEAKIKTERSFSDNLAHNLKKDLSPEEKELLQHINDVYQAEKKEKAQELKKKLRIMRYETQLENAIKNQDTILLVGGTGCGKTVGFPFIVRKIMEQQRDAGEDAGKFVITEPTIINTDSLTAKIASDSVAALGYEVDCKHSKKEEPLNKDADTVLMTERSLINMFLGKSNYIRQLRYLMIDEAHAVSTDTVILIAIAKEEQERRKKAGEPDLKLFVTSATIDETKFSKHLGIESISNKDYLVHNGVTKIEGTEPDITDVFADDDIRVDDPPETIAKRAAKEIAKIIKKDTGDIIHFVPGKDHIKASIEAINHVIRDEDLQMKGPILPPMGLDSKSDGDQKEKATKKNTDNERRIIAATNFAETGLTIEGLKYVTDTGLKNEMVYDPQTKTQRLMTVKASKDECLQRRGRVGRVEHGEWRPLYTQDDLENEKRRDPHIKPEILQSDLRGIMLLLKKHGKDLREFNLLYKPDDATLDSFENDLAKLGALKRAPQGTEITNLGRVMESLSINFEDIHHQRMIADAKLNHREQLGDICALIALTKRSLLKTDKDDRSIRKRSQEAFIANSNDFVDKSSDFVTLLKMWNKFKSLEKKEDQQEWADRLGLNIDKLRELEVKIDDFYTTLLGKGETIKAKLSYDYPTIKTMIENAYKDQIMINKNGSYNLEDYQPKSDDLQIKIGNQSVVDPTSPKVIFGDIYVPSGKKEGYLSPCQVIE